MKTKPILCPHRLRHVPRQFSWIDQRFVRDRHIQGRSHAALALYLFLCNVADAQGTSYYADPTVRKLLCLEARELKVARTELITAGLIAYRAPFYQVLSLEPWHNAPATTVLPLMQAEEPRTGEMLSLSEIFRSMLDSQNS